MSPLRPSNLISCLREYLVNIYVLIFFLFGNVIRRFKYLKSPQSYANPEVGAVNKSRQII